MQKEKSRIMGQPRYPALFSRGRKQDCRIMGTAAGRLHCLALFCMARLPLK